MPRLESSIADRITLCAEITGKFHYQNTIFSRKMSATRARVCPWQSLDAGRIHSARADGRGTPREPTGSRGEGRQEGARCSRSRCSRHGRHVLSKTPQVYGPRNRVFRGPFCTKILEVSAVLLIFLPINKEIWYDKTVNRKQREVSYAVESTENCSFCGGNAV